jgi:hypothetical protein
MAHEFESGFVVREQAWHSESNQPNRTYRVMSDDGGGEIDPIVAASLQEALAAACELYRNCGGYDTTSETVHVCVTVWSDETGEEASETVVIEQDAPECIDDEEHDWAAPHEIVGGCVGNPGVWSDGAAIMADECCLRCGCRRRTVTEPGSYDVSYEPGYYSDEIRCQ